MASDAQLRAQDKYDSKMTKQFKMKLNVKTDADILAKLDSVDNKQGYIKELIRRDIMGVQAPTPQAEPTPTINKFIVEGDFKEGEFVTVSIDGKEFRRKARYSKKWGDLIITIYNNEYAYSEFVNGGN